MNESEWFSSTTDPAAMLAFLWESGKISERKARLFAVACCRRIWSRPSGQGYRKVLAVAERCADGLASRGERVKAARAVQDAQAALFAGTVAENIAYGIDGASAADVGRAAELAGIHEEIMAMPGGYEAQVAERGQNLSGGQRQRLALARVFLKDPPVLVLDEATSALDTVSERKVQEALDRARRERTVILVAHRLSTLRYADRIAVFDGGRVVEVGTYQELVLRRGVFAELIRCAGDGREGECSFGEAAA